MGLVVQEMIGEPVEDKFAENSKGEATRVARSRTMGDFWRFSGSNAPFGGWLEGRHSAIGKGVRVHRARVYFCALPLLIGLYAEASVVPLVRPDAVAERRIVAATPPADAAAVQASLRRDVAEHPEEFVVFPTAAGASQFMSEHRFSVEMETSGRILSRGVMGYWQGKTIVVLPWEPLKNFQ
jgi:hypothetical protein